MVTSYISSTCIALMLDEDEIFNLRSAVDTSLCAAGFDPWSDIEAELYESSNSRLLLARPRSPLTERNTYRRRLRH